MPLGAAWATRVIPGMTIIMHAAGPGSQLYYPLEPIKYACPAVKVIDLTDYGPEDDDSEAAQVELIT